MADRDLVGRLAGAGVPPGAAVGIAVVAAGVAVSAEGWCWSVLDPDLDQVAHLERDLGPRWTWWSAAGVAPRLLARGIRPRRCWDLGAVHRMLHGGHRDDPAAVWAAAHGRPVPASVIAAEPTLLDPLVEDSATPLTADGDLQPSWTAADWPDLAVDEQLARAERWAALACDVQAAQLATLRALPDTRLAPLAPHLAELTARSESAAALLAVELEHDGLPVDLAATAELLGRLLGPRPGDLAEAAATRSRRDDEVLRHVPADARCDLRNPAQVRTMLGRLGFDLPDTRSWRLEPFRDAHPAVAALLAWRKIQRVATTYGYGWVDRHVGADGRLRGEWGASDGGAGRMTASAGLHNLPVELRPVVAAEPGRVLVRADLGQVEQRLLAAVSHDRALVATTADDDLYLPVAAALGVDRPTAKVWMLAAMYGQTSGTAAAVLLRMDAAYPDAMRYLRAAEQQGRTGGDVRTYGGRLVRGRPPGDNALGRYLRNAVVQGAAAEMFKAWTAAVRAGLVGLDGQLVLCLHDELLLHVPEGAADPTVALVRRALTETAGRWCAGLPVRFVADVSVVKRWSEAKS
ncbi:MAG: DNA polymerase [Lapillicoccus sp.]